MDMNNLRLGILGFGSMASAICDGLLLKKAIDPGHIYALGRNRAKLIRNTDSRGIHATDSPEDLVCVSDVILVGVLPQQVEPLLKPLAKLLDGKLVVCIAAGVGCEEMRRYLPDSVGHISTIPNTPVSVGEGIIVSESLHTLTDEQKALYEALFGQIAVIEYVTPELLSLGGTIAGCTPAFAAVMIEALGDAAVKYGMPREQAYKLVSQMLVGTGKLALVTGEHPATMKDAVCSPGGSTIRGVTALDAFGFRGALEGAIDAIMEE